MHVAFITLALLPAFTPAPTTAVADADIPRFARQVVADLNRFWRVEFRAQNYRGWRDAKLVLFDRIVETPCGRRTHRSGAIYCTRDHTLYVSRRGVAELAGDFAQALVIAHEMAHHVQLGLHITARTARRHRQTSDRERRRRLKIAHELQADCFAGVWARDLDRRGVLEAGDLAEAIAALESWGDDSLSVDRDRWKHGSRAQRVRWFRAGYRAGRLGACDTFNANRL